MLQPFGVDRNMSRADKVGFSVPYYDPLLGVHALVRVYVGVQVEDYLDSYVYAVVAGVKFSGQARVLIIR